MVVYMGGSYPDGALFRYDPVTNKIKDYGQLHEELGYVQSLALDEENNVTYVGIGGKEPKLMRVDLNTDEITEIKLPEKFKSASSVYDADLIDNKLFICIDTTQTILVYDLDTQEYINELKGTGSMGVSQPDNNEIVYTIIDETLSLYNLETGEVKKTSVESIELSRGLDWMELDDENFTGKTLVFITKDGVIHQYNPMAEHYKAIHPKFEGEPIIINSITEGPDNKIYVVGKVTGRLSSYYP